jgi:hypothetical protein
MALAAGLVVPPAVHRAASAATSCSSSALGGRVILQSDAVDPDVFVWDSRDRLVEYAAGRWGTTRAVFSHTVLAEPGTQAAVVACVPGIAHPKFAASDQDAIGVRLLSGTYRGKYGWILSGDAHGIRATRDAQADSPPHTSDARF